MSSVSQYCRILVISSLQRPLRFVGISTCTAPLRFHLSLSIRLRSGLDFRFEKNLDFYLIFSDILLQICCHVCDYYPVAWPTLCQALAVRPVASHLTLKCFGIQKSSWSTNCNMQRSCGCKTTTSHHPSTTMLDSWVGVFVLNMLTQARRV